LVLLRGCCRVIYGCLQYYLSKYVGMQVFVFVYLCIDVLMQVYIFLCIYVCGTYLGLRLVHYDSPNVSAASDQLDLPGN